MLSPGFNIQGLRRDGDILATLSSHSAKWHKTCRLHFYHTQLERATKRARSIVPNDTSCTKESDDFTVGHEISAKRTMYRRSMSCDSRKSCSVYRDNICFICDNSVQSSAMHGVTTLTMDSNVKECAQILGDAVLLAKLSDGDLVSQEAKYHLKCLTDLYSQRDKHLRQIRSKANADPENDPDINDNASVNSIVFAQLCSYIKMYETIVPLHQYSNLLICVTCILIVYLR